MMKVFVIIFLISLKSAYALDISKLNVECKEGFDCNSLKKAFSSLRRCYTDLDHIRDTIKLYVANEGVKSLSYKVKEVDGKVELDLIVDQKKKVVDVADIEFSGDQSIELPTVLPIKRDDYLDKSKIQQTVMLISEVAKDKGYPKTEVETIYTQVPRGLELKFRVTLNDPIVVKKINISSKSPFLKKVLWSMLGEYNEKAFDAQKIKTAIEETRKLFLQYGYYLAEIELKSKVLDSKSVILFMNIKNTRSYVFFVRGLKILEKDFVKKYLSNSLIGFKREMSSENVTQVLREKLELEGFKESSIQIDKKKLQNNGETSIQYDITADEGVKVKINKVTFKGSSYFSNEELKEIFYERGTSLIRARVHDEKYYEDFVKQIKELLISKGYVSVYIENPLVKYNKVTKKVDVTYRIREGIRTQVKDVSISGVDKVLSEKIKKLFTNVPGSYFNPIILQDELSSLTSFLKNEGYYFARIRNLNSQSLVQYKEDNSQVYINLDVDTGLKLYAGDIIIIGNNATRKILIQRELQFSSGDLITIEKIEKSQIALLSLGIFSSVQIQPVNSNRSKTDILVFVNEKDFGTIEVAPGIRTDIGLKISTIVNYSNIDGMNKRITFKGSVNNRLDLNTLDPERRRSASSLIEYDAGINYSENQIFYSDFDFNTQISKSRRRFYSFDADIQRLTVRLSKDFNRWFSSSVKYQFETISQFEATVEREHGHFQIGSITPAATFDFRDRTVNPTKGASFSLSCEFANPAMLSQQDDELTIDYYKLISRNRFYIPMSRDVIFAVSAAFGIQENRARSKNASGTTEGYIPNIKVFRLNGADFVRGFEDDEINLLSNTKEDVSQYEVNNRAYMANIKLEPRLMLSDSTVLGVFYDAGRIMVDEFKPEDLRSSVGLSFKYLTPVGTLDFDYGIKLLRKKDADGTLDSPGRLHVSIGFF